MVQRAILNIRESLAPPRPAVTLHDTVRERETKL